LAPEFQLQRLFYRDNKNMTEQRNIQPLLADYELIDCGGGAKLERFGERIVARPEPQALWQPSLSAAEWSRLADATFERSGASSSSDEKGRWILKSGTPDRWEMGYSSPAGGSARAGKGSANAGKGSANAGLNLRLRLALTGFKHVGVFPEQAANWNFIYDALREGGEVVATHTPKVLNLFAYTGGATLAARSAGAEVTHVDSVKQTVSWARDNAALSGFGDGIRWIVDDAAKFTAREVRRGNLYDGIILDPPAYGRGPDGEKWVLEQGIDDMLANCAALLKPRGFLVLNLYSMGLSPLVARTAVHTRFGQLEKEQFGELFFTDRAGKQLPLGIYYRFVR
jgi:23S rRNA (cytosine1962-C5)-methyltransferase